MFSLRALVALPLAAVLTGCGSSFVITPSGNSTFSVTPGTLKGTLHGGRQAIVGARVFLFENGVSGDAGPFIAQSSSNKSVSLLTSTGGTLDSTGNPITNPTVGDYYVLTDADGAFSLPSYHCDSGRGVYIYAIGGKPDGQNDNILASNMLALGTCPASGSFPSNLAVTMNEVSTVAMAYAVAGYASDATHISNSGTALAATGTANAFNNAAQLYTVSNGTSGANAISPTSGATVPQQLLNSLANTLAACVNSAGVSGNPCGTLLNDTHDPVNSDGTSNPDGNNAYTVAMETATAAIHMAHNPGQNVTALFQLPSAVGYPFTPNLGTSTPNDFSVTLTFPLLDSNDYLAGSPAVDAAGNVWFATNSSSFNAGAGGLIGYSPTGVYLQPCPNGGSTQVCSDAVYPFMALVDPAPSSGLPWLVNGFDPSVIANADQALPTRIDMSHDLPNDPVSLAFDANNYAWVPGYNSSYRMTIDILDQSLAFGTPLVTTWENIVSGAGDHLGNMDFVGQDSGSNGYFLQMNYSPSSGISFASVSFPAAANFPSVIDRNNNYYIYPGDALYKATPTTNITTGNPTLQTLSSPAGASDLTGVGLAIDGASTLWITSSVGSSPYLGFIIPETTSGTTLFSGGFSAPTIIRGVAVDGSGNVWSYGLQPNSSYAPYVAETIGIASPVVTPISPNHPANLSLTGLGVRP